MYIKRNIEQALLEWKNSSKRKPILFRGARQVGKSTTIRKFGEKFQHFVELNFEEKKDIHLFFQGNLTVEEICNKLSLYSNSPIIPGKTLLFFDEIQQCIPAISSLRYFYEQIPELHVIAAGSLLEFALAELPSFGVGRVRSLFLYPLSFFEFLHAMGEQKLITMCQSGKVIDTPFHDRLLDYLKEFIIIGGMPEVVANYVNNKSLLESQEILDDLITSLTDDFTKYKKNVPTSRLKEIFEAVVAQTGGKFNYSKASRNANHAQIKEAIFLLEKAGLIYSVTHTSANGLPLGAESSEKKKKYILFDTGLFQRILGLNIGNFLVENDTEFINKGAIAEMFAGIEIIKNGNVSQHPRLFYWHRESPAANAEIDYIIQKNNKILPVEIKASAKGSMQSLRLFMKEKNSKGIRVFLENFNEFGEIQVIPLYAAGYYLVN